MFGVECWGMSYQNYTVGIPDAVVAGLVNAGLVDVSDQQRFIEYALSELLEDQLLGAAAVEAQRSGYLGGDESAGWLAGIMNAKH